MCIRDSTIPFFEDIFPSKKRLQDSEEKEQRPKKKFMIPAKVKMIYEDDEEDDDVAIDVIKTKTKKRMVLPACIKDESSSEIYRSAMPLGQQQKPPITEQMESHKSVSSSTIGITAGNDNEEMIDKRERDTLEMLTKFQQRIKNKKILK